jgi:hypothetical protein
VSGIDGWSPAERQLFAIGSRAALDALSRQQEDWRESWSLDTTSTDAVVREHHARMRQLEEDHKAWLAQYLGGLYDDDDHQADDHELAQAEQRGASSAARPAPASGGAARPGQPDPHAAGLDAERLRTMSMQEYAARRADLGVRSATDMNHLFGETR